MVSKIYACTDYLLVFCMVFKNKLQMIVDVRLKYKIKKTYITCKLGFNYLKVCSNYYTTCSEQTAVYIPALSTSVRRIICKATVHYFCLLVSTISKTQWRNFAKVYTDGNT